MVIMMINDHSGKSGNYIRTVVVMGVNPLLNCYGNFDADVCERMNTLTVQHDTRLMTEVEGRGMRRGGDGEEAVRGRENAEETRQETLRL